MFRSLMTIIRELYLYLTEVFMLKHSIQLRRYIHSVMWQHVSNGKACFKIMLPRHQTHVTT